MKIGLRVQIVVLLALLLALAAGPLFYAVATYTRYAAEQQQRRHARRLGAAVARHLHDSGKRSPRQLLALLRRERQAADLEAIAVYDDAGAPRARVGDARAVAALAEPPAGSDVDSRTVTTRSGEGLAVFVPGAGGTVAVVVSTGDAAVEAAALNRFVALYGGAMGGVLLLLAYVGLTWLIVRPLGALATAAERVAAGHRHFEAPATASRELDTLAAGLERMTESLRREEASLRQKVDEIARKTAALEAAQSTLIRSERLASVGRLAAGLAHEIGNPLAAIIAMQEMVLDVDLPEDERRDFLRRMRAETERIHRILKDLLAFARSGAAATGPVAPGDVGEAVDATASLVRAHKHARERELTVTVPPDLPPVAASTEELTQILLNLLLNAADATAPGGAIKLTATAVDAGVALSVSDDGPGVDEAVRERLFEPFVTTKNVGAGSGLGLAVCRGLAEARGGSLELDASQDPAPGACFRLWLPAAAHSAATKSSS